MTLLSNFVFVTIASFLLTITELAVGQDLLKELPQTKEEFVASEKSVLATIDWLENTPFDTQAEKRSEQKALFAAWLTNSPTVTVELNANVLTFTKKNPDLLITFMGGWTRYSLQNNYSTDIVKGSLAGIRSSIKVYKAMSLKKDKELDKLIALDEKGDLENWVRSKLKVK